MRYVVPRDAVVPSIAAKGRREHAQNNNTALENAALGETP
jgi:hypothetical protein